MLAQLAQFSDFKSIKINARRTKALRVWCHQASNQSINQAGELLENPVQLISPFVFENPVPSITPFVFDNPVPSITPFVFDNPVPSITPFVFDNPLATLLLTTDNISQALHGN